MNQIDRQLKDFAKANSALFWQRHATSAGATMIAAYYVNITIALICYGILQVADLFDRGVIRRILEWDGLEQSHALRLMNQLTISSVFASGAVVLYIIVIAVAEGPSLHLGPLFFLLAATLHAAMNNCQIRRVLLAQLAIYSSVFVLIPLYDIWMVRPPLHSELWMQLGVVLFVLYFLIECSRKFHQDYQAGLAYLEELRVERDRAAEAYKAQSQFVSVVSHELRTPLTSVRASLDLMHNEDLGTLPDTFKEIARIGQKSSHHLATLIDDLLDFQKLNSKTMTFRFSEIELNAFVRDAADINRAFSDTRDITIRIFEADAPLYIKADPSRMMQVIGNVLSNAIKFSHPGGTVDVTLQKTRSKCRILIKDNGIGIPENCRDVVFEPFKQIDSSDNRGFGGTGLGMSICKRILESHGGAIDYASKEGIGTTFIIEMPAHSAEDVDTAGPKSKAQSAASLQDDPEPLPVFTNRGDGPVPGFSSDVSPEPS